MFCPECGEVGCTVDQPTGAGKRLWWVIRRRFRQPKAEDRPETVNPSDEAFHNKSDTITEE